MLIRPATREDVPAINALYNTYVTDTAVTFDVDPSSLEKRYQWFEQFLETGRYRIFVAEEHGALAGYTASLRFRVKKAYQTSVETTIYVQPDNHGKGVGPALYRKLFEALDGEEVHRAYGGIALPNEPSIKLHESAGFRHIGTWSEVGYKLGRYWDVAWYERPVNER